MVNRFTDSTDSQFFLGHWLAPDSNKDLYIGENDVKEVETTWAALIQCFNSSLFFGDEDVQVAFWLRTLFVTIQHAIFLAQNEL